RLNDEHYLAHCAAELAMIVRRQGDAEKAKRMLDESLAVFERLSDSEGIASALYFLGCLAFEEGDTATASERLQRSLAVNSKIGLMQEVALCLEQLGAVEVARGEERRAACLLGVAEGLRQTIGVPVPAANREVQARVRTMLRKQLGEEPVAEATRIGRDMDVEALVELACNSRSSLTPEPPQPAART